MGYINIYSTTKLCKLFLDNILPIQYKNWGKIYKNLKNFDSLNSEIQLIFQIEFLPIYTPNQDEIKDPIMFANNVRDQMAKSLGIPISERNLKDNPAFQKNVNNGRLET